MPTAPSGPISLARQRAKVLLANSATWISWTGSANATAAMGEIYVEGLPKPANKARYTMAELQGYRPFAIVGTDDGGFSKTKTSGGGPFGFDEDGKILVMIEADVAVGDVDDAAEAAIKFGNNLGAVVEEMATLAGTEGTITVASNPNYLNVNRIELYEGPERSLPDVRALQGDFFRAILVLSWGI